MGRPRPMQRRCSRATAPKRIALALAAMLAGTASAGAQGRTAVHAPASAAIARAEALLRSGRFGEAATVLGGLIQEDPANRRAREMLAFAFESSGELDRERQVRSELAAEAPA